MYRRYTVDEFYELGRSVNKGVDPSFTPFLLSLASALDKQKEKYSLPQYYIAGGAIRDTLLDLPPKDYDVFFDKGEIEEGSLYGEKFETLENRPGLPPSIPVGREEEFSVENYLFEDGLVQLIEREVTSGLDLINDFDYNVVKGYYNTEDGFVLHDDFVSGMLSKKVDPINPRSSDFAFKAGWKERKVLWHFST